MRRVFVTAAVATLVLSGLVIGPAGQADASHISCSLFSVPLAHPGMGSWPYEYGVSGYGQISCSQSTQMTIIVQLAINGDFNTVVEASRTCPPQPNCSVETVIICCYLASDWSHTRASGIYDNGHGNFTVIPWTSWKCYQNDPGMRPSGMTPGALVAARVDLQGGGATGCTSYRTRSGTA